jgi:pilus assembly protein CpaF
VSDAESRPAELVDRVRHRLVTAAAPVVLDDLVRDEADGIIDDAVFATLRREVAAELTGAGPLEALLALPGISDVVVNAPDSVWLDRGTGLERAAVAFPDDAAVRRLAQRLAAGAGRRLDDAMPFVDATLPDGTRLHAVLPPLCPCTTLSLRVLGRDRLSMADLVDRGTCSQQVGDLLAAIVAARLAFVITGGTGAGKTTLLGSLLALVPPNERVLVIEDAPEIELSGHAVRLLTRPANVEGAGAVGLRELVRQSLRMRPDRLVVGEFRGAEMVELLVALNTGHEGGAATLHANSAAAVASRLVALGALAGVEPGAVAALAASALDVVVHVRRRNGDRRVHEIGLLGNGPDGLTVAPVLTAGVPGAAADALAALLADRGVPVPPVLRC